MAASFKRRLGLIENIVPKIRQIGRRAIAISFAGSAFVRFRRLGFDLFLGLLLFLPGVIAVGAGDVGVPVEAASGAG